MAASPEANKRKIGVHVSLDLDTLARLDAAAKRMKMTRSQLLRYMVDELTELEDEREWVEKHAEAALGEKRVSWKQAKAALGL